MLLIGMMVAFAMTKQSFADDFMKSVVELPEVGAIVSVHPYSAKEERKKFQLYREWRHFLPVGVMVRNVGSDAVSVEHVDIVSDGDRNLHAVHVYPHVQRVAGSVAGKTVENDGLRMSAALDAKYGRQVLHRPIRTNEIFYVRQLEPATDYYGIVYLDLRDKKLRKIRIKDLDGVDLGVKIIKKNLAAGALAHLLLDGQVGFAETLKGHDRSKDDPEAKTYDFYVGKQEEKPSASKLYEAMNVLEECEAASFGKQENKKLNSRGKYVTAKIDYNKRGEQVSFEIIRSSGSRRIDDRMKSIADNMKDCKMPDAGLYGEGELKEPFFSYVTTLGDKAAATWKPKGSENKK